MKSSATKPFGADRTADVGGLAPAVVERRGAIHALDGRHRCEIGTTRIAAYRPDRRLELPLAIGEAAITLVVILAGSVEYIRIGGRGQKRQLVGPSAMFLARPGRSKLLWHPGSEGLVLQVARTPLQILASAASGQALRVTATEAVVIASAAMMAMMTKLAAWVRSDGKTGSDRDHWYTAINTLIADALVQENDWGRLTVVARAAHQAHAVITEQMEGALDLDRLAVSHGITLRTLREAFSACYGKSLSAFLQETRLSHARERLSSRFDSRTIQEIADAAGFRNASSFTRAYVRLFGEPPTRTRARSVKDDPVLEED